MEQERYLTQDVAVAVVEPQQQEQEERLLALQDLVELEQLLL